jgi:hypothetical protein
MLDDGLLLAAEGIVAVDALEHVQRIVRRRIEQGGKGGGGAGVNHHVHFRSPPF